MSVSIGVRPMGYARRMGRPVPIGAAIPAGSRFDQVLSDLASDPFVQIAGRDGSMSLATPGTTFLDPPTGQAIAANRAWNMIGPGGLVLPMYTAFPAATNLFLNSQAPATQNVSVVTGSVTVTAIGSGYTITTSAGTATGSGFGAVTMGTPQVLTITGNGTITLTVSGTPVGATVQVQSGAQRTPLIVTAGSSATRAADANVWTMADALTQDEEMIVLGAQDYADGDMGISTQTWSQFASGAGATNMFRSAATSTSAADKDSGSKTAVIIRGALPNRGVCFMHRHRRRAGDIDAGYGRALSGSPVAGGPWEANTAMRIGHSNTAGRAGYGRFACIRRKGGFTQAQIDALFFGFANGRTIPVAA